MSLRYASLIIACLLAAPGFAAESSNSVRLVSTPVLNKGLWQTGRDEILARVLRTVSSDAAHCTNAEIIGWSLRSDDSSFPPRLFEDAIVVAKIIEPGTNKWVLAYASRRTGSPRVAADWEIPYFPPAPNQPIVTYWEFTGRPAAANVAQFIRGSDFGYNVFYPEKRVLDVVLYDHSPEVVEAAQTSITSEERKKRYWQHLNLNLESLPSFLRKSK
jgi:hypothetical protein